ncbi:MAG: HD domain-containing protein [Bacteroidales bacterium]|nr:HD domain-containing protein [Bacteroidales bacterium]
MIGKTLKLMTDYFGKDVIRINHALKVFGYASTICRNENLDTNTIEIIELASILHDIGIPLSEKKYNSSAGKYQEIEGPPIACEMLEKLNIQAKVVERVCHLIGNHHTYSKIDGVDFQILVEADFLVNIFEDNMSLSAIESVRKRYFKITELKFQI